MNKPKGIIFDCDGCILDSEAIFLEAVRRYLNTFNIESSIDDLKFVVGKPMTTIAMDLLDKYHLNLSVDEFIQGERVIFYEMMNSTALSPMPGLLDLIQRALVDNIALAIASSSPKNYVLNVTDKFGITDKFQEIITGEQVEHGKPYPDIYLLAASKLAIAKDELIIIEDSTNGIQAGISAGIYTVGYKGSIIEQDTSKADVSIDHYDQLKW